MKTLKKVLIFGFLGFMLLEITGCASLYKALGIPPGQAKKIEKKLK